MSLLDSVAVTRAGADDMAFVLATWAESFRRTKANRRMPTGAFHAWHRPRMMAVLDRRPLLLVARDTESPSFLYGWLCAEAQGSSLVAHYAFTKLSFQRQGIASLLLGVARSALGTDGPVFFTHRTAMDRHLLARGLEFRRPIRL